MRIYRLPLVSTSVSAQVDIAEINPATSQMLKLLGIRWGQTNKTGDANENDIAIQLITGFTTSGSGGNASVTPVAAPGDSAFGGTCESFNTTLANTGTTATINLGVWNIRSEFLWVPVPYDENPAGIWIPYNTRAVIRIAAAPAAATTITGEVLFGTVGAA